MPTSRAASSSTVCSTFVTPPRQSTRNRSAMRTSESATVIEKDASALRVVPNLVDYEATRATFDWAGARAMLDGLPGGGCDTRTKRSTGMQTVAVPVARPWSTCALTARGERRPTTTSHATRTGSRTSCSRSAWQGATGCSRSSGHVPELHIAVPRRRSSRRGGEPLVLGVRSGTGRAAPGTRRCGGAGDQRCVV